MLGLSSLAKVKAALHAARKHVGPTVAGLLTSKQPQGSASICRVFLSTWCQLSGHKVLPYSASADEVQVSARSASRTVRHTMLRSTLSMKSNHLQAEATTSALAIERKSQDPLPYQLFIIQINLKKFLPHALSSYYLPSTKTCCKKHFLIT